MRSTSIFLAISLLLGCGSNDDDDASGGTFGPSLEVGFQLTGDEIPAPLQVPFPTDLYLDANGRVTAPPGAWDAFGVTRSAPTLANALVGLDGFGRSVGAIFALGTDDAPTTESLVSGKTFAIVDIENGEQVPAMAGFVAGPNTLTVNPDSTVLGAGRRYAIVLTTGIRTSSSAHLGPSADLARILALGPDERTTRAELLYGDAADVVASAGFRKKEIAGLAVFTTSTRHRLLRNVRDRLVAGELGVPPNLDLEGGARFGSTPHASWTATLDEWLGVAPKAENGQDLPGFPDIELDPNVGTAHDAIGAVLNGTFPSPELRRPFAQTADPDDGTIEIDANGEALVANPSANVPVTIVLPKAPVPESGWPVVLFGHGTPTHRSYAMSVANELARAGFAVVAIDAPEHGMRTPLTEDGGSAFTGPYSGPDGMADAISSMGATVAAFGGFVNLARARDTRAQTIVDYCQTVRLVRNPALDLSAAADEYGGVTPKLDGSRVGWAGVSFGGINGLVLAGVEPDISAFFLDVGGGNEFSTFGESPANLPQLDFALSTFFGLPHADEVRMSRFNPALTFLQMAMDPTDPALFAGDAVRPEGGAGPSLYLVQVLFDESVPNSGTESVARAMGIPQITLGETEIPGLERIGAPFTGDTSHPTRAIVVDPMGTHGRNLTSRYGSRTAQTPFPREDAPLEDRIVYLKKPVTIRQPVIATQASMLRFLDSALNEGVAVIDVKGLPEFVDFDDDGWTDEEETTAGSDPFDPAAHPDGPPPHPRNVGF